MISQGGSRVSSTVNRPDQSYLGKTGNFITDHIERVKLRLLSLSRFTIYNYNYVCLATLTEPSTSQMSKLGRKEELKMKQK